MITIPIQGLIGNVVFLDLSDELSGFEEAWKGTAQKHLPGWAGNFGGHESAGKPTFFLISGY